MRTLPSELCDTCYVILMADNHRSWIHSIIGTLDGKPLLDMVGGVIGDYEYLWTEYYFSTATL